MLGLLLQKVISDALPFFFLVNIDSQTYSKFCDVFNGSATGSVCKGPIANCLRLNSNTYYYIETRLSVLKSHICTGVILYFSSKMIFVLTIAQKFRGS